MIPFIATTFSGIATVILATIFFITTLFFLELAIVLAVTFFFPGTTLAVAPITSFFFSAGTSLNFTLPFAAGITAVVVFVVVVLAVPAGIVTIFFGVTARCCISQSAQKIAETTVTGGHNCRSDR